MGRKPHRETGDILSPKPEVKKNPVIINKLRPQGFAEFVGQNKHIENLKVYVQAAKERDDAIDHIIFSGPPGLGKTTLSHIIANEMGKDIHKTSGPAVEHKGVLAGMLTNLSRGDILFIDELHRLSKVVQENLYSAMEDFQLEIFIGEGANAQAITIDLPRFTLIGATTRAGLLTAPLRTRFGIPIRLNYYSAEDLAEIVMRAAGRQDISISADGAYEIGSRARGTPRIANRLLMRVRDFTQLKKVEVIHKLDAAKALERLEVDDAGLDPVDRKYLSIIINRFDGGPVGIDAIAAGMGEERDTLEDVYEPYLLQKGFIKRTPKGRVASARAYQHLGINYSNSGDFFS
ncbi:MAG: Holliday junction branch migration DNA helicase RuvB [Deltaproteobacteria bacterium]|jgi:Holliday junction DNA helicase RuvB|nr:Holliday junction branch migration DNA helicase RuvB [Deltaproteobacteria bacterium]